MADAPPITDAPALPPITLNMADALAPPITLKIYDCRTSTLEPLNLNMTASMFCKFKTIIL